MVQIFNITRTKISPYGTWLSATEFRNYETIDDEYYYIRFYLSDPNPHDFESSIPYSMIKSLNCDDDITVIYSVHDVLINADYMRRQPYSVFRVVFKNISDYILAKFKFEGDFPLFDFKHNTLRAICEQQ